MFTMCLWGFKKRCVMINRHKSATQQCIMLTIGLANKKNRIVWPATIVLRFLADVVKNN